MKFRSAICLLAVGATVVAACGSDDESGSTSPASTPASSEPTSTSSTSSTASTTPGTAGSGADAFVVDASDCPAEATTALAPGADIVVGSIFPQSGNFAAFSSLGVGVQAYFKTINDKGGVDGHKIVFKALDDVNDPARVPALARELVEQDKVFATVLQIGTPNVAAAQSRFEESCTPQLWVGASAPKYGDPEHHSWTTNISPPTVTEVGWFEAYIKSKMTGDVRIAQISLNNDFGNNFSIAVKDISERNGWEFVADEKHETTATNVDSQVSAILAADPDVVLLSNSGPFCTQSIVALGQGGYDGTIIAGTACSRVELLTPAGEAAEGVLLTQYDKNPNDPAYDDDADVKQFRTDIEAFSAGAAANSFAALGYVSASLFVQNLLDAVEMDGGLTRANVMTAAWNMDTQPGLWWGPAHLDGVNDAYAAEAAAIRSWDAAAKRSKDLGIILDTDGALGSYQGE